MIRNLAAGQAGMTSNVFLIDGERTVLVDVGAGFDVVGAAREHVDNVDAVDQKDVARHAGLAGREIPDHTRL